MGRKKALLAVALCLTMLAGGASSVFADETALYYLHFKNGKSFRCDAVWKGIDDYVWCRKAGNVQGYPKEDLDMKKTFELQAAVNRLVDRSAASFSRADWDGTIAAASGAIALDPKNEVAFTNRAGAYANTGKLKEAIEDCNTAIEINPHYAIAYNNRGYALELAGDLPQAVLDYQKSCTLGYTLGCRNYDRVRLLSK